MRWNTGAWVTWPRLALALVAIVVSLQAGLVRAQNDRRDRPSQDEFQGMMDAYVLSRLQEALDLTDEQYGRMVVAQKKLQDARRAHRRSRIEVIRQLRQQLRSEQAGEAELAPLLEKLDEIRSEFLLEENERYQAIDEILDIRQQARYRILETEIQRRLQELIRRVRGGGNPQRQREPFP